MSPRLAFSIAYDYHCPLHTLILSLYKTMSTAFNIILVNVLGRIISFKYFQKCQTVGKSNADDNRSPMIGLPGNVVYIVI